MMNAHVINYYKMVYNQLSSDLTVLSIKPEYGGIRCTRKRLDLQYKMIEDLLERIQNETDLLKDEPRG